MAIRALVLLPLTARLWLQAHFNRPLLWVLFHLETESVTIAPVGPGFCRYPLWVCWQDAIPMVLGTYEPEVVNVLRREIAPADVCVDIGAHVGYYVILMARLTGERGRVWAFEPVPENFEVLQKNIVMNSLANAQLALLAVSEQDGAIRLTLRDEESTMTASASGYAVRDQRKVIDVATCSLDGYLAQTGSLPDLLLIDVEGAELAVLKGATITLKKARPKLLIEIHGWTSPERDEVSRFLSRFGYQRTILGHRASEAFVFFRPCLQPIGATAQEVQTDDSSSVVL